MSQSIAINEHPYILKVENVGVDAGAAWTKVVSRMGTALKPSAVKFGSTPVDAVLGKASTHAEWEVNNTAYTVSDKVNGIETGSGAWYSSDGRIVMAHDVISHALQQGETSKGCALNLTFVTPIDQYYDTESGRKNKLGIDAQLSAFEKSVKNAYLENKVVKAYCLSEGVAAIVDYILDNNGSVIPERKTPVPILCVDIGGSTIDVAHTHGLTVDLSSSTCIRLGISKAIKEFKKHLPAGLHDYMVRDAFNTGKAFVYGKEQDFKEVKTKVVNEFAAELLHWFKTSITSPSNYHKIIFVGGGAELLKDFLTVKTLFPNLSLPTDFIHIPKKPALANARGAYKYSVRMSKIPVANA